LAARSPEERLTFVFARSMIDRVRHITVSLRPFSGASSMQFKHLAAVAAFAVIAPASSHAQLGGLVRKAKEAAANKVVENNPSLNRSLKPSNAFGPELTAQSLDGVLLGLATTQVKLGEADALRLQRQKIDADLGKSYAAHDKDRLTFDERSRNIGNCQDSVVSSRKSTSQDAYMKRMQNDPVAQAKMIQATMGVSQQITAAQMKGDSVEVRRLMIDLAKSQGIDPKADSLVAIKSCGAVPVKPAWYVEQDSLRARSARLDGQVRDIENGAAGEGAKASGMTVKDYSLARERVLHWYIESKGATPIQAFGSDERKLLESRKADIVKFSNALQGA
jgi:hypothetical protein